MSKRRRPTLNPKVGNPGGFGSVGVGPLYIADPLKGREPSHFDVVAPSGRVFSGLPFEDRILANKVSVYSIGYSNVNVLGTSKGTGAADGTVQSIGTYIDQMFNRLVQRVEYKRFVPNSILTAQVDFDGYLSNYAIAFLGLRALMGILAAGNANATLALMCSIIDQQRIALEAQLRRLSTCPVPPAFNDHLDRLCGVFSSDPDGPMFVVYVDTALAVNSVDDLTQSAAVTAVITSATNALNSIESSTAVADMAVVQNLMALAYGANSLGPKLVNTDRASYASLIVQAFGYHDTTAGKVFVTPAPAYNSNVPILCPRENVPDWYMTLLRFPVANGGTTISAASVEYLGTVTPNSAYPTTITTYNFAGVGTIWTGSAAAASTGVTITDAISWNFSWAAFSSFEIAAASGYTLANPFEGFEVVYVTIQALADETIALYEKIFSTGLII